MKAFSEILNALMVEVEKDMYYVIQEDLMKH